MDSENVARELVAVAKLLTASKMLDGWEIVDVTKGVGYTDLDLRKKRHLYPSVEPLSEMLDSLIPKVKAVLKRESKKRNLRVTIRRSERKMREGYLAQLLIDFHNIDHSEWIVRESDVMDAMKSVLPSVKLKELY